jgi:phosphopantetheine--protein transferase-like protein
MLEIKKIISTFINKNVDEINNDTIIDKTVINGSILIHRMFATLASNNYKIDDYTNIKTYGDLLDKLNKNDIPPLKTIPISTNLPSSNENNFIKGIGIDIENISNLPLSQDFREDQFYLDNFTPAEISYCIMKSNPYQSFTGLFCIKEAIYKSNSYVKTKKFNEIEITHTELGAPIYPGFMLTLSHTNEIAVAVAIAL